MMTTLKPQILLISKIPVGLKIEYIGAPSFTGNPEHLLTATEAAHYLQVHPETVRDWCRKRRISYIRLGRCDVRFRREDLAEFVESRLNRRKSAFKAL
jgi:excisionase family DNA binding protein